MPVNLGAAVMMSHLALFCFIKQTGNDGLDPLQRPALCWALWENYLLQQRRLSEDTLIGFFFKGCLKKFERKIT